MVSFLFFGVGFFRTEFYVYRGSLRGNYLSRNNKCSFLPLLDFERHFFGVWQKILARLSKLHSASLEDLSVVNEITGKKNIFFWNQSGIYIKNWFDLRAHFFFFTNFTQRKSVFRMKMYGVVVKIAFYAYKQSFPGEKKFPKNPFFSNISGLRAD